MVDFVSVSPINTECHLLDESGGVLGACIVSNDPHGCVVLYHSVFSFMDRIQYWLADIQNQNISDYKYW